MRTLLFLFTFFLFTFTLQAQYIVINVKESVYANKKLLKKKDKIAENATLRFSSGNAFAYVMSPGNGYYILGVKESAKEQGEFLLALKDALLPPNEFYAASTRSYDLYENIIFEDQYDIKAFFRNDLFFVSPARFEVSAKHFPLDSTHYFAVRHQVANKWLSSNSLPHSGQSFEISKDVFRTEDKILKENAVQRSELYYINKETKEELFLGNFKLRFVASDTVKEELTTLYTAIGNMPVDEFFREHAMPYLNVLYGRTQLDSIKELVAQISKK